MTIKKECEANGIKRYLLRNKEDLPYLRSLINSGDGQDFEHFEGLIEDVANSVPSHTELKGSDVKSLMESEAVLIFHGSVEYIADVKSESDSSDIWQVDTISVRTYAGKDGLECLVETFNLSEDEGSEIVGCFEVPFKDLSGLEEINGIGNILQHINKSDKTIKTTKSVGFEFIAVSSDAKYFYSQSVPRRVFFTEDTEWEGFTNSNKGKEDKDMTNKTSAKATAVAVVGKNKAAAISVARMTAGKVAMDQVTKLIKPKLPMMARSYAETPLGKLVMANLFNFAISQYLPDSEKANLVADVMLEGAMLEAMSSLNIEEQLNSILESVDVSKITG